MQTNTKKIAVALAVAGLLGGTLAWAASAEKSPIKEVMQKYHKAPKGTDPVCKKVQNGAATKDELHGLVEGYKIVAAAKPPQGDDASWKEKTSKLVAAAMALEKGEAGAVEKYKAAVNCKACHSVHKPE